MRKLAIIVGVLGLIAVVIGFRFARFITSVSDPSPARVVFYDLKGQESPRAIARDLEKAGAVSSSHMFYWYARLTGRTSKFKAGDYKLTTQMTPDEVLAIITSGVSFGVPFTVPEGYTYRQIAQILDGMRPGTGPGFVKFCEDPVFVKEMAKEIGISPVPRTLEGYLFPDTYMLERKTPVDEIIRRMVRHFRAEFTPEFAARAKELRLSLHQVITLASIVEKETGAKNERTLISSVFHNRLKKHMRLASDPTVIYGKGAAYAGASISRKDLDTWTAYNTYRIAGLPPGPISNPGIDALRATLYPAQSNYLFFVSHNDGTSEFTETFEQHQRAVQKFQINPSARQGKSWRDLNRSKSVQ